MNHASQPSTRDTGIKTIFAWWVLLALLPVLSLPASAQEQQSQSPAVLKNAVILMEANSANDAITTSVQAGPLALDLSFQVRKAWKDAPQGKLTVTNFLAQTPPATLVETKIGIAGAKEFAVSGAPLQVPLTGSDLLHVKITGSALRPATTYKGMLFLAAGGESNRWELTLTTGAQGILAVDPVATSKFSTFPPCSWVPYLDSYFEHCGTNIGEFSVTLRDKTEGRPYHNVRVRFEPSGTQASKVITSNFSLDTFSFWQTKNGRWQQVDLEQREADVGVESPLNIDIDKKVQRTLLVKIKPLSPGEYSGALRFAADETSDDAADAKLPLTIQVRHHWTLPVAIILFGSLMGWFSSKYVVGYRKISALAQKIKELRARADYLARPEPSRNGWAFSCEATSYGLVRVRVMLSQLAKVVSSVIHILSHEQEIQLQLSEATLRLAALEKLRDTRLRVQPAADCRPAAQIALGRLLRCASNLLERPSFTQDDNTKLNSFLQTAEEWLTGEATCEKYRVILNDRLHSRDMPDLGCVQALPQGKVRTQLDELLKTCPTTEMIIDSATTTAKLREYDQTLEKLVLLWREAKTGWGESLAQACAEGKDLDALFNLVDEKFWGLVDEAGNAGRFQIERDQNMHEQLKAYDITEVHLKSNDPLVDENRMLYHPLRVQWRIIPPDGNVRRAETDRLTLVQYFPLPGKVRLEALLRWQGREIPIKQQLDFEVVANPDYNKLSMLKGNAIEWAIIGIASGFAVATAMGTLYDPSFGSFNQYLTLFLWAAGAGTGGNIFKQLGTTSTPGGQQDVPLSGAATEAEATAGK